MKNQEKPMYICGAAFNRKGIIAALFILLLFAFGVYMKWMDNSQELIYILSK